MVGIVIVTHRNLGSAIIEAAEFIEAHTYKNVLRWTDEISQRPAVKRGRIVNKSWGDASKCLMERHSAADFKGKDV